MLMDAVCVGVRPTVDPDDIADAPPGFVDLMKRCWSHEAPDRPGFDEINMILQDMLNARYHFKKNINRAAPTRQGRVKSTDGLSDEIGVELASLAHRVQENNPFTVTNFVKMMDGTKEAESKMESDLSKIFDLDCPVASIPEWPGAYIPPTILPYSPGENIKVKEIRNENDSDSLSSPPKPVPFTLGSRGDVLGGPHKSSDIDNIVLGYDESEQKTDQNGDAVDDSAKITLMSNMSEDSPPVFSKKSNPDLMMTASEEDNDDFWNNNDEMFTNSIRHIRKPAPRRKDAIRMMEERRKQRVLKNVEKAKNMKKKNGDDEEDNDESLTTTNKTPPKKLPTGTGVWGV